MAKTFKYVWDTLKWTPVVEGTTISVRPVAGKKWKAYHLYSGMLGAVTYGSTPDSAVRRLIKIEPEDTYEPCWRP